MFVQKSMRYIAPILISASLLLAGCNLGATPPAPTQDLNAINTSIVGTTIAQLSSQMTGTALAIPTNTPTATPTNTAQPIATLPISSPSSNELPTISFNATPLPGTTPLVPPQNTGPTQALGDSCNNSAFEADITIADGSILKPGEDFVKTWKIRNTGTCTWDDGFALVFIGGDRAIDPYDFKFQKADDFVAGGQAINISIKLTAPLTPGDYQGHWRMRNDKGYYFGTIVSVYFTVKKK